MVNIDEKMQYLRRVARQYIDPITTHPYYQHFIRFLDQCGPEEHYPRYALTMAEALNTLGDMISSAGALSVCETGGLSLISRFLINEGCSVKATKTDLRYAIDAADESIDLLLSLEVLEHIKDQHEQQFDEVVRFNGSGARKYVDEMWRVLKPGGFIVLTTPNPCSLKTIMQIIEYEPPAIFRPHVRE